MNLGRGRRAALAAAATASLVVLGTGTAQAELSAEQVRVTVDRYLFQTPLEEFLSIRAARPYADQLDWSSDGCTLAPNHPLGFDFTASCIRHDFGYSNYQKEGRFTEDARRRLDDQFKADMVSQCGGNRTCMATADLYYVAVRALGPLGLPVAQLVPQPQTRAFNATPR